MSAPFLVERGIDPSEEELGPALMMRLLLARGDHGLPRQFASRRSLWSRSGLQLVGSVGGDEDTLSVVELRIREARGSYPSLNKTLVPMRNPADW